MPAMGHWRAGMPAPPLTIYQGLTESALLSLMVVACILGSCLLLGAQVLSTLRLAPPKGPPLPTAERALFSLAAGMLLFSLVVLLLGLIGLLRPWVLFVAVVASGLAGATQARFV